MEQIRKFSIFVETAMQYYSATSRNIALTAEGR